MSHATAESLTSSEAEVSRVMQVCNACRYCEGFCAVFPAMTRLLEFGKADIHYLANLCHNCGACLHSCQYGEPHEFAINAPRALAEVRIETYTEFAWPRALGRLYRSNGLAVAVATATGLAFFLLLSMHTQGGLRSEAHSANFYSVFSHDSLVMMFGLTFGFALLALGIGVIRFWRSISPSIWKSGASLEAATHALTLKYLDGGHGEGCNEADDRFTLVRRRLHHFTFYGFLLCFASTSVATLYHYMGQWHAPYPLLSLPVLLGVAGGVGLLVGPLGLLWLNFRRAADHGDKTQRPMDRAFIVLLLLVSVTGLVLLAGRASSWMPALLAVHLGCVMALFLTMPYGKFAHGIYRSAALLKSSIERRTPPTTQTTE